MKKQVKNCLVVPESCCGFMFSIKCLCLDLKMPEISLLAALLIDLVKECYFYYCKVLSTIAFKTCSIVLIRLNTRYTLVENILVSSSMTDFKKKIKMVCGIFDIQTSNQRYEIFYLQIHYSIFDILPHQIFDTISLCKTVKFFSKFIHFYLCHHVEFYSKIF